MEIVAAVTAREEIAIGDVTTLGASPPHELFGTRNRQRRVRRDPGCNLTRAPFE